MPEEIINISNKNEDEQDRLDASGGILDTVSFQEQNAALRTFNPEGSILELLEGLKPREKQILINRHGLLDGIVLTLETVGRKLNLTRERIRQIEHEAIKRLNSLTFPPNFASGINLIFQVIENYGNITKETRIIDTVLTSNKTEPAKNSVLFILKLIPRFNLFKETQLHHQSWYITGFDRESFEQTISVAEKILREHSAPLNKKNLFEEIKKTTQIPEIQTLTNEAIDSFLSISKIIHVNPFQQVGLMEWPEISPRDVGDKAYLVLLHHGHPEHYVKITEMINKQDFDKRVAHKETVHNELIKDDRFVLVGRGTYALSKWGYKTGVVAEIIQDILNEAQSPLTREEIIERVQKQRLVKINTIIVGLSNRKLFRKTTNNRYTIA